MFFRFHTLDNNFSAFGGREDDASSRAFGFRKNLSAVEQRSKRFQLNALDKKDKKDKK